MRVCSRVCVVRVREGERESVQQVVDVLGQNARGLGDLREKIHLRHKQRNGVPPGKATRFDGAQALPRTLKAGEPPP